MKRLLARVRGWWTHGHVPTAKYHDDSLRWARFGQAIDKERSTR